MTGTKRGRPPKPRLPKNVASCDAQDVERLSVNIERALRNAQNKKYFHSLNQESALALSKDLALELACFPAMQGLIADTPCNRTGPKPKSDFAVFAATVRDKLMARGVELSAWTNGRCISAPLAEFCNDLLKLSPLTKGTVSGRTLKKLPDQGFHSGQVHRFPAGN